MNDAARELIGRTLAGRFRITGFLGEGAMAAVYGAEQDAEPHDIALKVMHPELLQDNTFAKRFAREAKAAARIVHRNTVRIVDHGSDGEHYYLAMERLVGQDLFDTLVRERKLPEVRAVRIAVQVCAALEAAHAQRIVHRDLKPENVFIERDPDDPEADLVKVLDFGIAKIMEREKRSPDDAPPSSEPISAPPSSAVLTQIGSIVGTPEYMAPEQALGLAVDARTDVYACGVLLFHMLAGRAPFTGKTPIEVILQVSDQPPPAPSTLVPGINARLEALILKTLAKMPEQRPQSALHLRTELEQLLLELTPGARRSTAPPAAPGAKIAKLPGVPGEVSISTEPKSARRDEEPPATLRSRPVDEEKKAAGESTEAAAEATSETSTGAGTGTGSETGSSAETGTGTETGTTTETRTTTEPSAVAATSKPSEASAPAAQAEPKAPGSAVVRKKSPVARAEAVTTGKTPEPPAQPVTTSMFASAAEPGWNVPPWMFFVALAAIAAALWLLGRGAR